MRDTRAYGDSALAPPRPLTTHTRAPPPISDKPPTCNIWPFTLFCKFMPGCGRNDDGVCCQNTNPIARICNRCSTACMTGFAQWYVRSRVAPLGGSLTLRRPSRMHWHYQLSSLRPRAPQAERDGVGVHEDAARCVHLLCVEDRVLSHCTRDGLGEWSGGACGQVQSE